MPSKEESQLKTMQRKLADKKEQAAELRGEKQSLLKQLKTEGCETVEDAVKVAASEEKKAEKLRGELKEGIEKLESDYEWG